ncbi:MAG: acylneuraminate cytidylyltransferase, partial [Bacteroidota bacterium]
MLNQKGVAFVPVRGGSKSIPLKNIKSLCGKPLIYWNLEALELADCIDKVVVATDSEEIANCATSFGFNKVEIYYRDAINARDTSSTESVMLEYLNKFPLTAATPF